MGKTHGHLRTQYTSTKIDPIDEQEELTGENTQEDGDSVIVTTADSHYRYRVRQWHYYSEMFFLSDIGNYTDVSHVPNYSYSNIESVYCHQ